MLTKFDIPEHEGPDVVAEAVGVELLGPEVELGLDLAGQARVDGPVELEQHPEGQGRAEHLHLHQLVQGFLKRMTQRGVSVQLVRHYEAALV